MNIKHTGTLGYLQCYNAWCEFDSTIYSRIIVICGATYPTEEMRLDEVKQRFLKELRHYARKKYGNVELRVTDGGQRVTYTKG